VEAGAADVGDKLEPEIEVSFVTCQARTSSMCMTGGVGERNEMARGGGRCWSLCVARWRPGGLLSPTWLHRLRR
jgi:hypothetical protein